MGLEDIDFRDPVTQFLADKTLAVPLSQVLLFAFVVSLCLLLARFKLGLLVAYCFTFYWGFIFNRMYFINLFGDTTLGLYTYVISGFLMFLLALYGLVQKA